MESTIDFSGYDPNMDYHLSHKTTSRHCSRLMYLVINLEKFSESIIKEYLSDNLSELNDQNQKGWTVLMIMTRSFTKYGIDLIRYFLDAGADPNLVATGGWTAFMLAMCHAGDPGCLDVAKLLIEKGADPKTVLANGNTALMVAIRVDGTSRLDVVEFLIRNNIDYNRKYRNGFEIWRYMSESEISRLRQFIASFEKIDD